MVKLADPRVFQTIYVGLPDEDTTGHCQVQSGVFEHEIDEYLDGLAAARTKRSKRAAAATRNADEGAAA